MNIVQAGVIWTYEIAHEAKENKSVSTHAASTTSSQKSWAQSRSLQLSCDSSVDKWLVNCNMDNLSIKFSSRSSNEAEGTCIFFLDRFLFLGCAITGSGATESFIM